MNVQTKTALIFASGYGQNDTHTTTLNDGRPNPSKSAGEPYEGITAPQVARLAKDPLSMPKEKARWFIPSSYCLADARSHQAQREHGHFFWLPVDIDQNNLSLEDVLAGIHAVVPDATCLIYSSRSATEDNRKWRGLVPLGEAISGADYQDTMAAFCDLLEAESGGLVVPDRALCRPGQLIYLPNRGAFYEYRSHCGALLRLGGDHPVIRRREKSRAELAAAAAFAKQNRERAAKRSAKVPSEEPKPLDRFNQSHSVADLLERYGYIRAGHSNDWRSPMQTSGSYATRDFGDHWISLSGNDATAEIGKATPGGHRFGDAFDLFVHFEKDGDFARAVRDYAEESGLHLRREPGPEAKTDPVAIAANDVDKEGQGAGEVETSEDAPDWPFMVNESGVWKRFDRMEKETGRITTKWIPVCSELHVRAATRDTDGEEWGRLLEVVDRDGRRKRWAMPMSLMAGDGSAIRDRLFSLGLVPSQARDARQALLEYIGSAQPENKVHCVSRIGWSGGAFVLPTQTIGDF